MIIDPMNRGRGRAKSSFRPVLLILPSPFRCIHSHIKQTIWRQNGRLNENGFESRKEAAGLLANTASSSAFQGKRSV